MSEERVSQFLVRIRQPAMVERVTVGLRAPGARGTPSGPTASAAIEDYHVRDALYDARFEGIAQHEQIQVAVLSEEHVGRLRLPSHADAPSTARIWPAWVDRFAEHDPDVEWPSDKHEDPIGAIVVAFDRLREKDATARLAIPVIERAAADPERDWGETLGKQLDAAGVTDADKIKAVARLIEQAQETLACTRFDGDARAEGLACVFDKLLEATRDLVREIAAVRP